MTFRVFGYGSLVNRGTLPPHVSARPARLDGWRRAWRAASRVASWGVCAVSIQEADGDGIDGLVVTFEDAMWPVIEAREHRYVSFEVACRVEGAGVEGCGVEGGGVERAIAFRAEPAADRWGDRGHPVHLTYVDVIVQGFLREFGEGGARRFMESTDGWHVPVLDDRDAPRYPRAQVLTDRERAIVDALLAERGVEVFGGDTAGR